MHCHRCGNILPTHSITCPNCYQQPDKTRRFVQADAHKTQVLIQVERCTNCGFLIYPGDMECQSCGTWFDRSWQPASVVAKKTIERSARQRTLIGLLAGVMTGLVVLAVLFIYLNR